MFVHIQPSMSISSHQEYILLLSCEHAVNAIPQAYQSDFEAFKPLLQSHRGLDIGAQLIARHLQAFFSCALFEATVSRLLIDCNRSLNHASCFSDITKSWSTCKKKEIINSYYLPFRENITTTIQDYIQRGYRILHLSIHSFTPILNYQRRHTDIGLLYDPRRQLEKQFASLWKKNIKMQTQTRRVRMNYPYLGKSNGFTTSLRQRFQAKDYLGLELETNQAQLGSNEAIEKLAQIFALSLRACLDNMND